MVPIILGVLVVLFAGFYQFSYPEELPLATLTVEPQGPVFTGETVTLECVIESLSGWTYKWYKGSSRTPVSEGNTFTINGATEFHKGQYWCQGERRDKPTLSQPSWKTTLDVKELPLATLTVEPQSPVFTGETVTLKCVIASLSGWTYKWYKEPSSVPVSEGNTFTIIAAAESHKGQYWCQGERRDRSIASHPSGKTTLDVKELPLATLTVEPQSPVFTGETVTLECVIESLSGWTYKLYKGSSRTPVSEGNTFTINGAAESHKGQYWCQGERRDRPSSSQPSGITTLDVKELPLATLTVEPQGPVFTGETVTLECVIESLSGWTYKWYKEPSSVPVSEGNTFTIKGAAGSHKGQYWCQGERRDRSIASHPSGKTTLDVKELPLATLTVEPQSPVFTGETVTLECVIESLSGWTYKWYKESNRTPVSEGNTFTINGATASHKGQYWCQGERRDRPTSSQPSRETTLDVKELPLATLTVEPQSPVFTGETVTLKCVITSLSGWTYKWYKESNRTPVSEGNTFTINGATASHKGQYWCQGERRDRPTSSQPSRVLTLIIKALPLATLTVKPQSSVFIGETVTLKCVITSLSGWTYKLYKGSSSVPVSEGNTFTINGAAESHKGQYWCQGERRDTPSSSQPSRILTLDVKAHKINMEFSLQKPFTPELRDTASSQFKSLAAEVSTMLNKIYSDEKYGSQFLGTQINSFRPGSVVVDFVLLFKNTVLDSANVISIVEKAVAENHPDVPMLPIELKSIKVLKEGLESENITVKEGEDAKMLCSHILARSNPKYFCRDPCTDKDVLITSAGKHNSQRLFLVDYGTGEFTVTMSQVKSTDAGIYYCGVDRLFIDTYKKITLNVT
ncbi:Fc receptor-like protein 5 [Alosa pseudoharengus]|uniref:Fc receptor-like protein 5 n=1 Tax=Alosa pseudoharengus TaxID=34774 RepID=UPI003F8A5655